MADRHNPNREKWSDNLIAKLLYIFGVLFVLLFLVALFTGQIEGGFFGEVDTGEIDTVPP